MPYDTKFLDNYFTICISAKTYRPTLLMLENYKCFPLKLEDKPFKTKNTLDMYTYYTYPHIICQHIYDPILNYLV